jgi:hypothetical protein
MKDVESHRGSENRLFELAALAGTRRVERRFSTLRTWPGMLEIVPIRVRADRKN